MASYIIYCEKCGKILGLVTGPGSANCPGCGRQVEARPVEGRKTVAAARRA